MSKTSDPREPVRRALIEYYQSEIKGRKKFVPGVSKVQYSGAVYDEREILALVDAILDGWFGVGKYASQFEREFSRYLTVHYTVLTNSGSSANLLAMTSLVISQGLQPGDEVITPAVTFPTTFNPIIQNRLLPVLVDVDIGTYNLKSSSLEKALSPRTRAIMLPHTLGNPNAMDGIMAFGREHGLQVIEDACDALGSTYDGKLLGTFGIMGTFSFYVAHHITMGEGGAVVTNQHDLEPLLRSLRDWGRACTCRVCLIALNPDYKCPLRFFLKPQELFAQGLPPDYDRKYLYQHIGYNMKPVEFQAAMGQEQLKKLPDFIAARKRNFKLLYEAFSRYADFFFLPCALPKAQPCWFAFPITLRDGAPFSRRELVGWFEENNIETRLLFAGNIVRQPAYQGVAYRIAEPLVNSDKVMRDTFFIGLYPGLGLEQMDFMLSTLDQFMKRWR